MENELTKSQEGLVTIINKNDLGDLLKPLIKEIHLFDTYVAGISHLEDQTIINKLKINDYLNLLREDNKFDNKAILILNNDNKKIGYVPKKDNIIFSRLMDAGKMLKAKIISIEDKNEKYKTIKIAIFLVDF